MLLSSPVILVIHLFFISNYDINNPATTDIYTLSLHDALPILSVHHALPAAGRGLGRAAEELRDDGHPGPDRGRRRGRSEEHTSELQSHVNLVCRLLLEKKKMA